MENVSILAKKNFTMENCSSQIKVLTDSGIKNVLQVDVSDVCTSCEVAAGFVVVSGKTKVNAIYVSSENEIKNAEFIQDFTFKSQHLETLENAVASATAKVSSVSVASGEILVFCDHKISVSGNYLYELSGFDEGKDDLVIDKKPLGIQKIVATATDDFVVAEEFETSQSGVSVLGAKAEAVTENVSVAVDKVIVSGKVFLTVTQNGESGIFQTNKEFEFKQEVEAVGTLPNMVAEAVCSVSNITVTPEINDEKTTLVCVADVRASVTSSEEDTILIANDIFSLKNEISTTYGFLETENFSSQTNFSDTILSNLDVLTLEGFDDIISVISPVFELDEYDINSEKITISGTISYLVLYKNSEGQVLSAINRVPAKLETSCQGFLKLRNLKTFVTVSSFKVKAGKDLEVMLNIYAEACFSNELSFKYIKSYEPKLEKNQGFTGIRVYVAGAGESVFDVARNLNVTPQMITEQNEVSDRFETGEKIYVYCPSK